VYLNFLDFDTTVANTSLQSLIVIAVLAFAIGHPAFCFPDLVGRTKDKRLQKRSSSRPESATRRIVVHGKEK
jgi:hypothetical protein